MRRRITGGHYQQDAAYRPAPDITYVKTKSVDTLMNKYIQ